MNFFGSIFSDDHDDSLGYGDSRKGVGGATLNGQDENILHLVLSHRTSSVLHEQDGRAVSGVSSGVANRGDSAPNSHNDTAFTTNLGDPKIIQMCIHQLLIYEKAKVKKGKAKKRPLYRYDKLV
ncbi:hypothetical protein PCYB_004450 [Plasmodium cynomolgi strain B]|uniref:Uncharacterized protein n=1 Tax=Plasmodium cynomolgi (strain B) TaxID=1120755 RepID=K6UF92_PLACD|nr:hypothetical protein PCYB_004450 [Plasmodium cynomolgi strain B]GAB69696.1 hypothetical protein PCYB_004450 [Plasmodium cynomolgi strain B]